MTSDYYRGFVKALNTIDLTQVEKAADFLKKATFIFVGGNGGSAAIAEHLTCDIQKGCRAKRNLPVHSLSSNLPLISAIANDIGYEHIFSHQLDSWSPTTNDVVVLISSSGNSPNIIEAAKYASTRSHVIGLTGFDGGKLRELADIPIHVDSNDYGHIEDCHSHIMHTMAHWIKNS